MQKHECACPPAGPVWTLIETGSKETKIASPTGFFRALPAIFQDGQMQRVLY